MELELFTVYIKAAAGVESEVTVEINEEIVETYGLTLEELNSKFNKNNLLKCVNDFINCLESEEEI